MTCQNINSQDLPPCSEKLSPKKEPQPRRKTALLEDAPKGMRRWSEEEKAFLVNNYASFDQKHIAKALLRTVSSVSEKAMRIGIRPTKITHGATRNRKTTRLYSVWKGMKSRCRNQNNKDFKHYGGRGISICDEWFNDYSVFETWAYSHGYSEGLQIDRWPNKNGNYEPSNCRWANRIQQANNKVSNRIIETKDGQFTLTQACRYYGCSRWLIVGNLDSGMTGDEAITSAKLRSANFRNRSISKPLPSGQLRN